MADAPGIPAYDHFWTKFDTAAKGKSGPVSSALKRFAIALAPSMFVDRPNRWVDMVVEQMLATVEARTMMSEVPGALDIVFHQFINLIACAVTSEQLFADLKEAFAPMGM
jgi:hypothetical protein